MNAADFIRPSFILPALFVVLFFPFPAKAQEPTKAGGDNLDLYGDPLPKFAISRLGTVKFRPQTDVWAMDISPDGKLIATGTMPGSLRDEVELWNAQSHGKVGTLLRGTNNILDLAFSPDGRALAVSHDRGIEIVSVQTRKVSARLDAKGLDAEFWAIAWSPDGKILAAVSAGKQKAWLWDTGNYQRLHEFALPDKPYCLAFAPDGLQFAIGGRKFLQIYEVAARRLAREQAFAADELQSVAWSPTNNLLALGMHAAENPGVPPRSRVEIWGSDGKRRSEIKEVPERSLPRLAFSVDGKTLLGSGFSESVFAWDVASGNVKYRIENRGYTGHGMAISRDGSVLATAGRRIALRDTADGKPLWESPSHGGNVFLAHPVQGGKAAITSSSDGTLRLWDLADGALQQTHPIDATYGLAVSLSADGKWLAQGTRRQSVQILDGDSFRPVRELATEDAPMPSSNATIGCVHFLSGGELVSGAWNGTVDLWDAANGKRLQTLTKREFPVASLASSANGNWLAIPAARMVEGFPTDWQLELWDCKLRRAKRQIPAVSFVYEVPAAFSPDGKHLVAAVANPAADFEKQGTESFVRLWNCETGKPVWTAAKPNAVPTAFAFSPSGKVIASTHSLVSNAIYLRSAATGTLLAELPGHIDLVRHLAFTADGKRLLSASQDATALVWDVEAAVAGKKE